MKENASDIKAPGMEPLDELPEAAQTNRSDAGRLDVAGQPEKLGKRLAKRPKRLMKKARPTHWRKRVGWRGNSAACKYDMSKVYQAYHLALLGLRDGMIAAFFKVTTPNLYNWRKRHSAFRNALDKARDKLDAETVKAWQNY